MTKSAVFFALGAALATSPAVAGTATFRASAYMYFLAQCYVNMAQQPDTNEALSTLGIVEPICACVATWDAISVTPDEFASIAATGVFPESFRTRKETYSGGCIKEYFDASE
jgi:hypothetical protein